MKSGIELIAQEQITKHHRSLEFDSVHNPSGALTMGACALISDGGHGYYGAFPSHWSDDVCRKMINKPYLERLIIAGALIADEIDRLNNDPNLSKKNP